MTERAYEIREQLARWRRDIHMRPDLGFQETCLPVLFGPGAMFRLRCRIDGDEYKAHI